MFGPPLDYGYAEIVPGLNVGAFPPQSPFDWGADVVVSLTSATACQTVPRNRLLIHVPIIDGEAPPDHVRGLARLVASLLDERALCVRALRSGTGPLAHVRRQGPDRARCEAKDTIQHVRAVGRDRLATFPIEPPTPRGYFRRVALVSPFPFDQPAGSPHMVV